MTFLLIIQQWLDDQTTIMQQQQGRIVDPKINDYENEGFNVDSNDYGNEGNNYRGNGNENLAMGIPRNNGP